MSNLRKNFLCIPWHQKPIVYFKTTLVQLCDVCVHYELKQVWWNCLTTSWLTQLSEDLQNEFLQRKENIYLCEKIKRIFIKLENILPFYHQLQKHYKNNSSFVWVWLNYLVDMPSWKYLTSNFLHTSVNVMQIFLCNLVVQFSIFSFVKLIEKTIKV